MAIGFCLIFTFLLALAQHLQAADPDPVRDFCLAGDKPNAPLCKDPSSAKGADFTSSILRPLQPLTTPNGFNATLVTSNTFPGLNTMGLSIARADLGPNGVVALHVHPRSSELIYIEAGTVQAGFVDTNNKLYQKTLQKGDIQIIPRGLVHFQWNVGKTPATIIAVFNSEDPGVQLFGTSAFGSKLPLAVLESSFKVNKTIIDVLNLAFS